MQILAATCFLQPLLPYSQAGGLSVPSFGGNKNRGFVHCRLARVKDPTKEKQVAFGYGEWGRAGMEGDGGGDTYVRCPTKFGGNKTAGATRCSWLSSGKHDQNVSMRKLLTGTLTKKNTHKSLESSKLTGTDRQAGVSRHFQLHLGRL